jgi:hypothetical protein
MTDVTLGPFTAGEIPVPVVYQFQDAAGAPLNLTGYTAKLTYLRRGGTAVTRDAVITTPLSGEVTYTWVAADFDTAGSYKADLWVGNLTNRYASVRLKWYVTVPVATAPAI